MFALELATRTGRHCQAPSEFAIQLLYRTVYWPRALGYFQKKVFLFTLTIISQTKKALQAPGAEF